MVSTTTENTTTARDASREGLRERAVFTIVQNEPVFLPLWLTYYRRHFEAADIYVLDHDSTDGSTAGLDGWCHVVPVHRGKSFDHQWLRGTVQAFQQFLLQSYRAVLFAEADELVVADPTRHHGLAGYIRNLRAPAACCTGYNIVHYPDEPELRFDLPILRQRRYWHRASRYCKRLLSTVPLAWSVGFHEETRIPQAAPDPGLFLFHLHRVDYGYCLARHRAAAGRDWNELDVRICHGWQNRIVDDEPFHRWFYGDHEPGGAEREIIPEHLRDAF